VNGADAELARLATGHAVYAMSRFPVMATYLGGSSFDRSLAGIDGRLRNYAPDALAREDTRWRAFRERFARVDPAALSPQWRIDRSVALAQIEFLLHQHQVLRHQLRALDSFVDEPFRGIDWQIQGMTPAGDGTRGTDLEWRRVVARARAVPAYLKTAREQIAAGVSEGHIPDWRVLAQFGLQSAAADAEYFDGTLGEIAATNLASRNHGRLLKDLRTAGAAAAGAYRELREFVARTFFDDPEGADASALKAPYRADRFALGETHYDWAVRNNLGLAVSARELYEESWSAVEATRASMLSLAREIAASRGWQAPAEATELVRFVFDRLSADAPRTDAEMLEAYRDTGRRLTDYARKTGLFEVPPDYRLEVTVTPPPLRSSIDGAAYYPAPAFKQTGIGRFYVTPTGERTAVLREKHNFHAMPDLAAHEGFPGHDWHYQVMSRHRDRISPLRWLTPGAVEDSSSMWEDSMAGEGWALYVEALLAEPQPGASRGFYTPEERLYQLRGQLYRDLRVRIDTGIHTERMSFDEAVALFSEVVDFLPGSCTDARALERDAKQVSCEAARAAVTRYARWPTQAITYRLGKAQILELRRRAEARLGERFSLQRFHLELMRQGTIPPAYFAEELLRALETPAS
jgi:uncharacterized protein (DUF885 family)